VFYSAKRKVVMNLIFIMADNECRLCFNNPQRPREERGRGKRQRDTESEIGRNRWRETENHTEGEIHWGRQWERDRRERQEERDRVGDT
jgi:hypothetical protein